MRKASLHSISDYNSPMSESAISDVCDTYRLKNLFNVQACFKNATNLTCINLFLIKCPKSFQDTQAIDLFFSNFQKKELNCIKNAC